MQKNNEIAIITLTNIPESQHYKLLQTTTIQHREPTYMQYYMIKGYKVNEKKEQGPGVEDGERKEQGLEDQAHRVGLDVDLGDVHLVGSRP